MTEKIFHTEIKPHFYDCDVAGIAFHGVVFRFAHNAFEAFLEKIGLTFNDWFRDGQFAAPIKKCEAEYFKPMLAGREYLIESIVEKIGSSSICMKHTFLNSEKEICAVVKKVHVHVDKKNLKAHPIPEKTKERFSRYLHK